MKVILLFDSDKLKNCYKEYTLLGEFDKDLREGKWCSVTFCHPDFGEVCLVRTGDPKDFEEK